MIPVFFETNHDLATATVHQARRAVWAGFGVTPSFELFSVNATVYKAGTVHARMGKFELFSGMSHGSANAFESQSSSDLYDIHNSARVNHTVNQARVHLYSCDCGITLGPLLVNSFGARSFIGYTGKVSLAITTGLDEEFVKVSVAIDRSILAGDTAAVTKTKADAEALAVEARLRRSPIATPRDVAVFRVNQSLMVGPWTDRLKYGNY